MSKHVVIIMSVNVIKLRLLCQLKKRNLSVYVQLNVQVDVLFYMYSLFLSGFALHVSDAICTHPQEHKMQRTALGVCNGLVC
jgi:hypothetical protein